MLQAIGNKILVKPIMRESDGSIVFSEPTLQNKAIVLSVGDRVEHVKPGNTIIHSRLEAYSPGKIELDGNLHFLIPEKDVLAIVGNDN